MRHMVMLGGELVTVPEGAEWYRYGANGGWVFPSRAHTAPDMDPYEPAPPRDPALVHVDDMTPIVGQPWPEGKPLPRRHCWMETDLERGVGWMRHDADAEPPTRRVQAGAVVEFAVNEWAEQHVLAITRSQAERLRAAGLDAHARRLEAELDEARAWATVQSDAPARERGAKR